MDEQFYEILDGVRRSKAALIAGQETIAAQINGVGPILEIPLEQLLSPKEEIDTTGVRGLSWGKILRATQNGVPLPPIEIAPGTRGTPLAEVRVAEDELDALRKLFGTPNE